MTEQPAQLSMIEEIKSLAADQLGDWLGVSPVYQPADAHHWQEVYDLACETADWQRQMVAALNDALLHIENLLDMVDESVTPKADMETYTAVRKFLSEMTPNINRANGEASK